MAEPRGTPGERGAALLTVLVLVAVMAVVTTTVLERLTIASRIGGNAVALQQARAYALAAEAIAAARISDLVLADPKRTTTAGGWNGTPRTLPLPAGRGVATVSDGGNCFNLNSVVSGKDQADLAARAGGIAEFRSLMRVLGVDPRAAVTIANATADWIDTDDRPQPNGAEDDHYQRSAAPYRTANRFMADISELRVVAGVTPAIYAALKPWLCVLPTSDLAPINVDTLLPDQAPLLAMLFPDQMSTGAARGIIAAAPPGGYADAAAFWGQHALIGLNPSPEATGQVGVVTRWFTVRTTIMLGDTQASETLLFDARETPVRLARRVWEPAT